MNHWLQLVTYKRGLIYLVFQKSGFLREVVVERFDSIMLCHDLIQTGLELRQNCKDLYGVTGALRGQYLIPKLFGK